MLLEEGTGSREQGTVRIERVSEFKNVLTVMRSAIKARSSITCKKTQFHDETRLNFGTNPNSKFIGDPVEITEIKFEKIC
ncbi:hypothetical protein PL9214500021 [Planktothrix tepida PCC 9214]|uniref:Uncharacterized protein n=1 Tax=Planktothrix tepida PCC 9214 TaxID=671072 RepID=A0A1J1LKQ3_9CYAN|nr:hypothetical protein PL9214500021 [Planktothrix tepida PCC 9214]